MIPGLTAVGTTAVSALPPGYTLATVDPLLALLANPYARRTYLLEAGPKNPGTDAIETVRLSNDGWASKPTDTPASTGYKGRLTTPYNAQVSVLRNGLPGGGGIPTFGAIGIGNPSTRGANGTISHEQDDLAGLIWTGYDLEVLVGAPTFARSEFGTIFSGTAEGIRRGFSGLELPLRGYELLLKKPVQSRLYWGFGPCLRFAATGYVDFGDILDRGATDSFTVEVLFSSTTLATFKALATKKTVTAANAGWQFNYNTSNQLVIGAADGTNSVTATVAGAAYLDGTLHRASFVVDRTAQVMRLYVDGELVLTSGSIAGVGSLANANPLRVGSFNDGSLGWTGELDDFRFWSVARTQAEIRATMHRELLGTETGLEVYAKLNEAIGTTAEDSTANNRDGTITAGTWVNTLEGGAELAGKPKPKGRGQVRDYEPVFVGDANFLIYQFNDRSSHAVNAVKDMGLALTPAGNVSDLFATTVAAGEYKTDLTRGLYRLGAKPAGKVTNDFQGDNTGSGYVSTGPDIVRRMLVDDYGFADPAGLDGGAFARANTANGSVCGYATRLEVEHGDEIATRILDSIWAWWTFTRPGLFTLGVVTDPADAVASSTIDANDVLEDSLAEEATPEPTTGLRLGYRRVWATQSASELATTLSSTEIARLGEPYQYAPAGDATVVDDNPEAADFTLPTCLDTLADAQAEADRRQAILGIRRSILRVSLVNGLHAYNVGDVVRLDLDRYSVDHNFLVVGWVEDVPDNITLLLWGRNIAEPTAEALTTQDGVTFTTQDGVTLTTQG
jgi:hypothetical protein